MKNWQILFFGIVIINLLALNILFFYLWKNPPTIQKETTIETKYIYPTEKPTSSLPSPTTAPIKVLPVSKNKSTTVIPIPGSGSTGENSWANISGTEFNLNTADYPGLKEAYLEVNMRLFNGNGTAFVRLFDVTAGVEVWGSEVKTGSQTFTAVTSDKLTLRSGNHLYRIQAKSLTADTTVYNSGSIKIITEN